MSLKKNKESSSYMDAVKVKVAEEYKPPPKINMPMTHTQRLNCNKQSQDFFPIYNFSMEKELLANIREWKNNRLMNEQQRKMRLEALKDSEEDTSEDGTEQVEIEVPSSSCENEVIISSVGPNNSNGMLMPAKVTNYSNILQPIPMNFDAKNLVNSYNNSGLESAFKISEFEADTSSPFDNVALKSINDVEELAKVLKIEDTSSSVSYSTFNTSSNVQTFSNNSAVLNFPNTPSHNIRSNDTGNIRYYNSCDEFRSFSSSYPHSVPLSYPPTFSSNSYFLENNEIPEDPYIKILNSTCPSVETISSTIPGCYSSKNNKSQNIPIREMNTSVVKQVDPLNDLPKDLQDLSRSISSMGFPLSRVARICKVIGNDNKKVLDHLLVMSELLDLGFPEEKISEALFLYDNDKDKALDKLLS